MTKQILNKLQELLNAGRREEAGEDGARVAAAARLLQVSDFEFFRIAYERWYGKPLSEKKAESPFAEYLKGGTVPFWARHSARQVLSRYDSGKLDPEEFGVERPPLPAEHPSRRRNLAVLMVVIYGALFLLLSWHLARQ